MARASIRPTVDWSPSSRFAGTELVRLPPALVRCASAIFEHGFLRPAGAGAALLGEGLWQRLEPVGGWLAWGCAAASAPFLRELGPHPLAAAVGFIELAESLVGIRGDWEIVDERVALRHVHHCPFAARGRVPVAFCWRLGLRLGQQLVRPLAGPGGIDFSMLATISRGEPTCEYRLELLGEPAEADARRTRRVGKYPL